MENDLSILETMYLFGIMFRMRIRQIKERAQFLSKLLELPPLSKRIKEMRFAFYQSKMLLLQISLCSGGEQRRVSFAVSLIQQPPLLILDEPTVGMDTLLRQRFSLYYMHVVIRGAIKHLLKYSYFYRSLSRAG